MAVLLAVYLAEAWMSAGTADLSLSTPPSTATLLAMGALNGGLLRSPAELYRLFTATLLHGGPEHIALNGIALVLVGWRLEWLIGRAWFATAFWAGGLGGSLMWWGVRPGDRVAIGASGAIMGLFALALCASFRLPAWSATRTNLQIRSLYVLVASIAPGFMTTDTDPIGYSAHAGGALGGALVGVFLWSAWPAGTPRPGCPRVALAAALTGALLYGASIAAAVLSDDPYSGVIPYTLAAGDSPDADMLARRYPRDPRGYERRALAAYARQDWPAAEAGFRQALRRAAELPLLFDARYSNELSADLAAALDAQGRREAAATALQPVCAAEPADLPPAEFMRFLRSRGLCGAGRP